MSEWLSIETAPRDGTDILIDAPQVVSGCTIAFWKGLSWRSVFDGKRFADHVTPPKFWMPLPKPPA